MQGAQDEVKGHLLGRCRSGGRRVLRGRDRSAAGLQRVQGLRGQGRIAQLAQPVQQERRNHMGVYALAERVLILREPRCHLLHRGQVGRLGEEAFLFQRCGAGGRGAGDAPRSGRRSPQRTGLPRPPRAARTVAAKILDAGPHERVHQRCLTHGLRAASAALCNNPTHTPCALALRPRKANDGGEWRPACRGGATAVPGQVGASVPYVQRGARVAASAAVGRALGAPAATAGRRAPTRSAVGCTKRPQTAHDRGGTRNGRHRRAAVLG